MILSPTHTSPLAGCLRLVAAWLVAILVMQGFQSALALGAGPRHVHRPAGAESPAPTHFHLGSERHHHAISDRSVQLTTDDDVGAVDTTGLALTLAMALMLVAAMRRGTPARKHVQLQARSWFWRSIVRAPLLRPPRPR